MLRPFASLPTLLLPSQSHLSNLGLFHIALAYLGKNVMWAEFVCLDSSLLSSSPTTIRLSHPSKPLRKDPMLAISILL
jgi:hypothetical protein